MPAPSPADEADRLATLKALEILDTEPEIAFENIVHAARLAIGAPITLISLVDESRQWFKARCGLEATETHRDLAFCAYAILSDDVMTVRDAREDDRFRDNPLVLGPPGIRAYAGAPLLVAEGRRLGTLCAIDTAPRCWNDREIDTLQILARIVVAELETRAALISAAQQAARLAVLAADDVRNRAIIDAMWEGMVVQAHDGAIISANPSACRILGLTHEQVLGKTSVDPGWRAIRGDGSDFPGEEHPAMLALKTGEPVTDVVMGVALPDGGRHWVQINAQPLFVDGPPEGREVVCTFADITVRAARRDELLRARQAAEEANLAKSAFLANMSHELRTPLNGVIGIAGALGRTKLDANQTEMIRLIESSGQALERLLTDVLDLSKVETGKLDLEIRPFNLHTEVEAAAQVMGIRAADKGVDFLVKVSDAAEGWFEGDALRIKQIVSNFASNAVKFTDRGRVTIRVDFIPDDGEATLGRLVVEVEDTGIGFDAAAAEQIFERFVQADASISRRFGGSGLGLSICRALAELMGGEVQATSNPGVGSIFLLSVPLRRATAETTAAAQESGADVEIFTEGAQQNLRILMAEDHPTNQRVVQLILEPYGIDLTIVENGRDAVEAWGQQTFDLILMDMQMPGMDGLTATREIRRLEQSRGVRRTPIAMLTANTGEAHRNDALAAGADRHIAKPVTPDSLLAGIEALISDHGAPSTGRSA